MTSFDQIQVWVKSDSTTVYTKTFTSCDSTQLSTSLVQETQNNRMAGVSGQDLNIIDIICMPGNRANTYTVKILNS